MRHTKIFKLYPDALDEMLTLRRMGWKVRSLARRYGCRHSTILHHLQKFHVTIDPEVLMARERAKTKNFHGVFGKIVSAKILEAELVDICRGKNYAEYREELKKHHLNQILGE